MLEEAAGTRMYEDKKTKAVVTIAKKQVKVDEINKAGRPDPRRPLVQACHSETALPTLPALCQGLKFRV